MINAMEHGTDRVWTHAYAPCLFASDGTGHIWVSPDDPHELCFIWFCG